MNVFYHAKLAAMAPKLRSDDGKHTVIRPLVYVAETDIVAYSESRHFPIIPCGLCGSQKNLQRKQIGTMLHAWEKSCPGRTEQIARALGNVCPSELADRDLFNFMSVGRSEETPLPDVHAWLAGSASPSPE